MFDIDLDTSENPVTSGRLVINFHPNTDRTIVNFSIDHLRSDQVTKLANAYHEVFRTDLTSVISYEPSFGFEFTLRRHTWPKLSRQAEIVTATCRTLYGANNTPSSLSVELVDRNGR